MATGTAEKQVWLFIEDNEWEGERWKVWFEADASLEDKLEELKVLIRRHNPDAYSLKQMDELPESYSNGPEECKYGDDAEFDGEGCGDCDYCCGSEGYFEPESQGELNGEILTEALEYYRSEGWNGDGDDPLYKLNLFNS